MACGSTYAHMLVTEDGKTPDDPWDWYAGGMDYDAWYDVAHRVGREVFRKWNWVLSIEDKLSKMDDPHPSEVYPKRDELLYMLEQFSNALEDLGHVLLEPLVNLEFTWEPSIRRAIAAGRDGTCVLELLDATTEYYERPPLPASQPPRQPGTGKTDPDPGEGGGMGGVLMTGALVAAGAYWWHRRNHKEKSR